MPFFECCVKCKRTFTDAGEFAEHTRLHKVERVKNENAVVDVNPKKLEAADVPDTELGETEIDAEIAAVREVNAKRKELIHAGIDAQTMKPEEVESRYATEKEKKTLRRKAVKHE